MFMSAAGLDHVAATNSYVEDEVRQYFNYRGEADAYLMYQVYYRNISLSWLGMTRPHESGH